MWIDTHCHLDASEFGAQSDAIAAQAAQVGVEQIVIPAVARWNFETVRDLAHRHPNCSYALGIHPIFVPDAVEDDLAALRTMLNEAVHDPKCIGIGEIGLDFFIPALCEEPIRSKQELFFTEQLKIARDVGLPVLLHVRRSQDIILKHVRRIETPGGIAHAFNGSFQQAETFISLGFKLGFGGAMTFPRALQLRRLASQLPESAIVLETDAPDIPPAWVKPGRNSPEQLPRIGAVLAELRGVSPEEVAQVTTANAHDALPRLARLGAQ